MRRRLLWFLLGFAGLIVVLTVAGGLYVRAALRASLPQLEGTALLAGLTAPVSVDRDRLGVPTITAASRADAARALGYLHAQDRFFQMDVQRRQAAGELSALVGVRALDVDRGMRVHRFRHIAREALKRTTPSYRALLESYAAGVNAGLTSLRAAPVEYLVLGETPANWQTEDAILTILAMFNTLQGRQATFEATFGTIAETMAGGAVRLSDRARFRVGHAACWRAVQAPANSWRRHFRPSNHGGTETRRKAFQ